MHRLILGTILLGVWCIFSQKASYYRPWDFLLAFEQALQRVAANAAKVNEVLSFIRAAFFFYTSAVSWVMFHTHPFLDSQLLMITLNSFTIIPGYEYECELTSYQK